MAQKQLQGSQVAEDSLDLSTADGSTLTDVNAAALGGFTIHNGANGILQLDGAQRIPAVDGSLITNLAPSDATTYGFNNGSPTRVVAVAGDTMTGSLSIIGSVHMETVSNFASCTLQSDIDDRRMVMQYNQSGEIAKLMTFDASNVKRTELILELAGNVSVNGTSPTAINHLTRKDYVDDFTKPIYDSGIIATAVTTIDITGLNLAPTESYNIVYSMFNPTGGAVGYYLTANGLNTTTDYYSQQIRADGLTVSSGRSNLPRFAEAPDVEIVNGSGVVMLGHDNSYSVVTKNAKAVDITVTIEDYAVAKTVALSGDVTSLRITSEVANGIGIGSRFRIYKTI